MMVIKKSFTCVAVLAVSLFLSGTTHAQHSESVAKRYPDRAAITGQIADLRAIRTPEGIETLEQVEIGGDKQWVSIRGRNRNNPVLLFLHGGPGATMMPLSWAYQNPWEDFFTVVQWDQRGSGKNADPAKREALAKDMTIERYVRDGEYMLAYLRKRFGKDKIAVMGLSWGTVIGTHLARRKPEWISVYVGVGQVADDIEATLYRTTLDAARADGNVEAVKALEAAPYPAPDGKWNFERAVALRKWARLYNGGWYGWPDLRLLFDLPDFAPEYSASDVDGTLPAASFLQSRMLSQIQAQDMRKDGLTFKIPMVYVMGRYDLQTPYTLAWDMFGEVKAPTKTFVTMERSAHFPMLEEPGRFLRVLLDTVLPFTEGSPEFAEYPRKVQTAPPPR